MSPAVDEKHTMDTRTAAPSNIHGSSLQASKILPWELVISSSTLRFCPPRMEFVATRPALLLFPASICFHALSNQYATRSAPPGTRPLYHSRKVVTYSSPNSAIIFLSPRKGGFPTMESAAGQSASVPSGLRMASQHLIWSRGLRIGSFDSPHPCRSIH